MDSCGNCVAVGAGVSNALGVRVGVAEAESTGVSSDTGAGVAVYGALSLSSRLSEVGRGVREGVGSIVSAVLSTEA